MSFDAILVAVGASVLVVGLTSAVLRRMWLSVPLVALAIGVVLGPEVTGALDPRHEPDAHKLLEELTRVALAVSLVGTALQFTRSDLRSIWRRTASLLTVGMLGMWLLTSAGAWLLLDLPAWAALLVGGILTPTDPVVASSLVTGRMAEDNLPRWLRRTLQGEAGANDGLALVFVLVPALVLGAGENSPGSIAWEAGSQVLLALAVGAALGLAAAKLVDFTEEHNTVGVGFLQTSAIALAALTLGSVHLLGGTGILGAFVAGLVFSLLLERRYAEELERAQDELAHLAIVPVFLLFGVMLPWHEWSALGWTGVAFALWALFLRRPPAGLLALAAAPTQTERRGTLFLSWYGPLGVAALYYALFVERYRLEDYERIFAACTLAIVVSVVVLSITATPGVRAYGRADSSRSSSR